MTIFSQRRPKYGEDPNFTPNTIIGEGVTFRGGMIKGTNSVMVSGLMFGDINVDGEVIITETGYVKGDITSTFAVVAGIVEGNINLTSYASLKSTASVTGDISCTAINIEDGAVFTGRSNMIVKSNALNKKLRKINEQAQALEEWKPPVRPDDGDDDDDSETLDDIRDEEDEDAEGLAEAVEEDNAAKWPEMYEEAEEYEEEEDTDDSEEGEEDEQEEEKPSKEE